MGVHRACGEPDEIKKMPTRNILPLLFCALIRYWRSGAFVDMGGDPAAEHATDPRAVELERRVVLSQYLTRVNSAGSTPPQETGYTLNSWYGKYHHEMRWWHQAHFALWQRPVRVPSRSV